MALELISQPIRTTYGIESNVVGMMSQIPYKFKRVDEKLTYGQSLTTGEVWTVIDEFNPLQTTEQGDLWYIDFDPASGYKAGAYSVSAPVMFSPTDWGITIIDLVYIAPAVIDVDTNFLTANTNYTVEITAFDRAGTTELLLNPIKYKPKQDGSLFVDLAGLVVGRVVLDEDTQFRIQYSENYNDNTFNSTLLDTVIGVLGRKQLLDAGGSTMWEYMANSQDRNEVLSLGDSSGSLIVSLSPSSNDTKYLDGDWFYLDIAPYIGFHQVLSGGGSSIFITSTPYTTPPTFLKGPGIALGNVRKPSGKFLTDFKRPKVWEGWKRSISYVLDDNLETRTGYTDINVQSIAKDRGGIVLETQEGTSSETGVNTFIVPSTEGAATQEVSMFWSPDIYMGETIVFDQVEICPNPVMIEWLNNRGGTEQHLFQVNQDVNQTYDEGLVFDRIVEDTYDATSSIEGRLSYDSVQKVTLVTEKQTVNFVKALSSIKGSVKVSVWLDKIGEKKIDVVVVDDYKFAYQTNDSLVDFSLVIQLPKNFDLFA